MVFIIKNDGNDTPTIGEVYNGPLSPTPLKRCYDWHRAMNLPSHRENVAHLTQGTRLSPMIGLPPSPKWLAPSLARGAAAAHYLPFSMHTTA